MRLIGRQANVASSPQSTGSRELDFMRPMEAGMTDAPDDGRLVKYQSGEEEVGVDSRQPGDLVEIRQDGTRSAVFAVYLGYLGGRHHFYASTGRWIMTMQFGSLFTVSNFASMDELAPVINELPKCSSPSELDAARNQDLGPSRSTASHLIDKMQEFRTKAEVVYLSNTDRLDAARTQLADKTRVKYLSLFEIAHLLLPASLKNDDHYPPYALYAVHTALYRDEIVFRPISPTSDCHRRDHLFEIFPSSFISTIERVSTLVRDHLVTMLQLTNPSSRRALKGTNLGAFVEKVQQVVRENRKERDWTSYGISAPSDTPTKVQRVNWSRGDKEILNYLQWWAMYDLFEPSSRFAAYGATILRALDLYEGVPLDESVAWTLMQELGIFQPWEMASRYKVRFPGTAIMEGGGLARAKLPDIEGSRRPDVAEGHRVDMTDSTTFCIDGPETTMIDDGISLERLSNPDEFWVHVHVADPASGIDPNSSLRDYMELIPENIYLPGHFQAMLSQPSGGGPADETQDLIDEYSLKKGSPALTFSTKMNRAGDILDYQVKPTRLGGVVYLDPADVSSFCGETRTLPKTLCEISVGTQPPQKDKFNRSMSKTQDLTQSWQEDLRVLHELGTARRNQRLAKGAWPHFFQRPSVNVQFHELPEGAPTEKTTGLTVQPPDPYIKITNTPQAVSSLVTNAMVLAGEVAARWCADRGIPAPFRQDSKSAENYEEAYRYATENIYPGLMQGVAATSDQVSQLGALTGAYLLETRPGPSFMMGLEMYVKVTSPLRRFSDMLAHWQIHAALAHERETGRPLNLSQTSEAESEAILPFGETQLSNTLSLLQMREKMAKRVSGSDREWILIALVRAWQFEKTAPATFRFTVKSCWRPGAIGELDWFGVNAIMEAGQIGDHALLKDIKIGEQFDVELVDVNVRSGVVQVRALRYYPSADNELPAAS